MEANPTQTGRHVIDPGCVVQLPEIFLPRPGTDISRWAVLACDQHTSDRRYWAEVEAYVGDAPSTLRLILPELYLSDRDVDDRIRFINQTMHRYLRGNLLRKFPPGAVLVERSTPNHPARPGLLLSIDLDAYEFEPGNQASIRASEKTVPERIPPRLAIRRDAALELPHVQVLIDDPQKAVIEPLYRSLFGSPEKPIYDSDLMLGGGHVRGWHLNALDDRLQRTLTALGELDSWRRDRLLMVVGDGNHSLATAKAHWQEIRSSLPAGADHPARTALVEMLNLRDPELVFEPIHRVFSGLSREDFQRTVDRWLADAGPVWQETDAAFEGPTRQPSAHNGETPIHLPILSPDGTSRLVLTKPAGRLAVAWVQLLADRLQADGIEVDYIHGSEALRRLASQGAIGVLLPEPVKARLFEGLLRDGVLPRKAFSVGQAHEKRYYLESRLIRDDIIINNGARASAMPDNG